MPSMRTAPWPPCVLVLACLLLLRPSNQGASAFDPSDPSAEMYCGTNWVDAFQNCHKPCPAGRDDECDDGMLCHGYTGCTEGGGNGGVNGGDAAANGGSGNNSGNTNEEEFDDPYKNNMCGTSWLTAMLSCGMPCPPGTPCPDGETCFAATNCDKPIEPIVSNMIMSLLGEYPDEALSSGGMGRVERGVFSDSVLQYLAEKMEENKVAIGGAEVTGQEFTEDGRRILWYNDTVTGARTTVEVGVGQGRRLPLGSSALDVSMTITGEYRPPPYQDMDLLIEESINRASQTLVREFRDRGARGGTRFFESVEDLSALSVSKKTERPTRTPTKWPTMRPTTGEPTGSPSYTPTYEPTDAPTRAFSQMIQTGYGRDLWDGTARSFGNIFEMKTKPGQPTVIVTGLDFYSAAEANSKISYEVWTKEGSWVGFEGNLGAFTKIAEGNTRSRGPCDESTAANCNFSRIPLERFDSVGIPGDGGSRSFYVTLTTKEIMYKRGESTSGSDFSVQIDNPDIEVYEGAGVLVYPFSQATEDINYSRPRGFLGKIYYDRSPCADGGSEWPCKTKSPSTSPPTSRPTSRPTPRPTRRPSPKPTARPTTKQLAPQTAEPTSTAQNATDGEEESTLPPSPKPVIDYSYNESDVSSTNIVVTLHNVESEPMNEREQAKYSEVLLNFLRSNPSLRDISVHVLNVTIWHQAVIEETRFRGKDKLPANSEHRFLQGETLPSEELLAETDAAEESRSTLDVTTIITTANLDAILPSDVIDVLLLHIIESDKAELMDLYHTEFFYTYFQDLDDVSGRIISPDKITNPPTFQPTTLAHMIATNVTVESIDEEGEDSGGASPIAIIGAALGILWVVLTLCGLCHLAKARRVMLDERLLNGQTVNAHKDDKQSTYLQKESSRVSVFDDFLLDIIGDDCSGTKLADCDEEEGTMVDSSESLAKISTFADLLPGAGSSRSMPEQRPRRNTFGDRLQMKMSTVDKTNEGHLKSQESSEKRPRRTTFSDRLQVKLSSVEEPKAQYVKPNGKDEVIREPSVQLPVATVDKADESEPRPRRLSIESIQRKLSMVEPKTYKGKQNAAIDPLQSLMTPSDSTAPFENSENGSASNSASDDEPTLDMQTMQALTSPLPELQDDSRGHSKSKSHRRASVGDEPPKTSSQLKKKKSRRRSDGDEVREESPPKPRKEKRRSSGADRHESMSRNSSKQSLSASKKDRRRSSTKEKHSSSSRRRSSGDITDSEKKPSEDKDLGSNLVEMLFA